MNYLSLSAALEERPLEESSLEASIVKAMTPVRIDQDKMQNYLENVDKTFVFANPNKKSISIEAFEREEFAELRGTLED